MGRRMRVTAELLRHTASRNVNEVIEDKRTAVQKAADWIAEFSGSIAFLTIHLVLFAVWIAMNVGDGVPGVPMFDPFPFGLLTMAVSLEAIILSVFVLLSQNRQAAKERVRGDIEYDVNLKAELEIAHLHEKVDRLTAEVLARLDRLAPATSSSSAPRNRAEPLTRRHIGEMAARLLLLALARAERRAAVGGCVELAEISGRGRRNELPVAAGPSPVLAP